MAGLVAATHEHGSWWFGGAAPSRQILKDQVFMGRRDKPGDDDPEGKRGVRQGV
jgi:hypothetical protein